MTAPTMSGRATPFAAALLLASTALLSTLPHTVAAADVTIATSQTSTVDLDQLKAGGGTAEVLSGVTVTATQNAILGVDAVWDLTNRGSLTGGSAGVSLSVAGSAVTNLGTIVSTSPTFGGVAAIMLDHGGTVSNSGTINSTHIGIQLQIGNGSVTNSGTVSSIRSAIALDIGSVTNTSTGLLSSRDATGVIAQTDPGTFTLTNAGIVEGGREGVLIVGGTINNSGEIRSTNASDASNGISFYTGVLTVNNNGKITGSSFYDGSTPGAGGAGVGSIGIFVSSGRADITNSTGATISGTLPGIVLNGDSSTVANSGTISSTQAGAGVFSQAANITITNNASGTISSAANPLPQYANLRASVGLTGANGIVNNSGLLQGAVFVATNGMVTNSATGRIEGTTAIFVSSTPNFVDTTGAFSGAITNAGTIVGQAAAATLTNTGSISSNAFGSTVVNAGTIGGGVFLTTGNDALTLRTGSTIAGAIDADAGTDTLFLEGTGTAANVFSNFETLRMRGTEWTLTGASTFGAVVVESGFLRIDGTLTGGPVTLPSTTGLRGTGRTAGAVANSAGTVAPGGATSFGTLTIGGNYTHGATATYVVKVNDAGQGDKLVVEGQATLQGGTVSVAAADGAWNVTRSYSILTATGGVSGTFADLNINLAYITPTLAYSANEVTLNIQRRTADIQEDVISETTEQEVSASARRVSQAVDARVDQAISAAFISLPGDRTAMAPGSLRGLAAGDAGGALWGTWATFTPTFSKQSLVLPGSATAQKIDGTSLSFLTGVDRTVGSHAVAGAFFSYESSDFDLPASTGERKGRGPLIGAYAGLVVTDWAYASVQMNHAWLTNRLAEGTFGATPVTGKFDSRRFMTSATLTAFTSWEKVKLSGKTGYSYTRESFDGYTASDGATVSPPVTRLGRLSLGTEVAGTTNTFVPYASAIYEWDVDTTGVGDKDGAVLGAGMRYIRGMLSVDLYGNAQAFRGGERSYSIGLNARYAF